MFLRHIRSPNSLYKQLIIAASVPLFLPGCILLNVTSAPINDRVPAETLSVTQDKSGYGLIAAMTDIPVAVEDYSITFGRTSQWCLTHHDFFIGPPYLPTRSPQRLWVQRVPSGIYAISTQPFATRNYISPDIRWFKVPDRGRVFLGEFQEGSTNNAMLAWPAKASVVVANLRYALGFSLPTRSGTVTTEQAQPPICASF